MEGTGAEDHGTPEEPGRPAPPRPTLALERTTLAWVRTALACMVVCVLLLRLAVVNQVAVGEAVAWSAFGASAVLGLWQRHRHSGRARRLAAGEGLAARGSVRTTTVFAVLLALSGLLVLLR